MSFHVLIIGGGVGGLALAHGLHKCNISFHVYEMDRTENYRAQGYRVRLGGPAIGALEYLVDEQTLADFETSCAEFKMASIPEIDAESLEVNEPKMPTPSAPPKSAPPPIPAQGKPHTVDRSAFREVLIKNLPAEYISYDKVFERYEETDSGITVYFADGSTAEGSLMVGADGAGSRCRRQLVPGLQVLDTGARAIYGKTPLTPELISNLDPNTTQRMSIIKDRSRNDLVTMVVEPIKFPRRAEMESKGYTCPPDYIFWVLNSVPNAMGFKDSESERLTNEESEQRALVVSQHWQPSVRAILEHQQKGETSAFKVTSVKDHMESWEPNAHATLIGDAAHKMTPTGSGALLALRDAQTLCELLDQDGLSKATIGKYEDVMRKNANEEIPLSWKTVQVLLQTRENERHFGQIAMEIRKFRIDQITREQK